MATDSLISKLKPDQLQEIITAFQDFDDNRNGSISPQEMKECLRRSKIPTEDAEINQVISNMDSDNDGHVSFEEYLKFMAHVYSGKIKQYKSDQSSGSKQPAKKK
jgi:Ca2+-binding EF-hand superfamily protein